MGAKGRALFSFRCRCRSRRFLFPLALRLVRLFVRPVWFFFSFGPEGLFLLFCFGLSISFCFVRRHGFGRQSGKGRVR